MELGSQQHKSLLLKGIVKTAYKMASLGVLIGLFLTIPSWVIENSFSMGLAYLGMAIIALTLCYVAWIVSQKYQKIIKPFNETYRKK